MATYDHPGTDVKEQARTMARDVLSNSESFKSMPMEEQRTLYLDLVNENIKKLSEPDTTSREMRAGDLGDFEGYVPGFDNSVDAFEDLVDSVDFPAFVADLMKSVFDANLTVMKRQTDDYIRLLKEATRTSAEFIKKTSDDDAFSYLAENQSEMFNLSMKKGADGSAEMTLTNPEGEPVDMEDNEVKAKIVEAKIAMAKEHRAALREVILMGVTRQVVDKGEIEASVEFRITANRTSNAAKSNTNTNVNTFSGSYKPPLFGLFGGPSGGFSNTNTNINVRTSNQNAQDEMFAKLMGRVKIQFKSDYFKLDNFAQMYNNAGVAAFNPNANQGQLPKGK
jgi:hypothetical protein